MICDKYTKVASIIFLSGIFFLSIFASEDTITNKAVRPDSSIFPVDCFDCCDTDNITDCQFNESISLLEVIISDIDALTTFEETCCAELNSKIDILIESNCCQNIITQADIDAGPGVIITLPGVYCLASDVTFATGNAITISNTSAEVVLDLQCHTITGVGDAVTAISIENSTGGVIVKNGTISNALNGISVDPSSKVTITNINAYNQNQYGILLNTGSNSILVDSVLVNGAGLDGILIVGTVSVAPFPDTINTTVSNTYISSCGSSGLRIDSVIGFVGKNIQSMENGLHGFHLQSTNTFSASITYESCIAQINQQAGFFAESSIDLGIFIVNYIDCKSIGNAFGGAPGFSLSPNDGAIQGVTYERCLAAGCTNGFETGSGQVGEVIYKDCVTHLNSRSGFYVNAQRVTISDCNANSEGGDGITLDVSANDCIVSNCYVSENGNIGINNMSGSSNNLIYSNQAVGNSVANYSPSVPLQLKPTDITGFWINVDPTASVVGEYESKIDDLLTCCDVTTSLLDTLISSQELCCSQLDSHLDVIEAELCPAITITSADVGVGGLYTISSGGTYRLCGPISYNILYAISIISSDPVVLDLNGYTITGGGSGAGILVTNARDVTICNGSIEGGQYGIQITGSTAITLEGINVIGSVNHGIHIDTSDIIAVFDSSVRACGITGLDITNTMDGTYKNVTLTENFVHGLHIDSSNVHTFENVTATKNLGNGFFGESSSNSLFDLNFKNCISERNNATGFLLFNTGNFISGVVFRNCLASGNTNGFELSCTLPSILNGVSYYDCISRLNGNIGFLTGGGTTATAVLDILYVNCEAQQNGSDGFFVDSDRIIIRSCIAQGNSRNGVFLNNVSSNSQVISCTLTKNNVFGIEDDGVNNLIHANAALDNLVNYSPSVPLQLKPTDITGFWINVDPTASVVGEYESKIDAILDCSCCQNLITQADIDTGSFTIDKPGVYCLATDVTFTAGNAITVVNAPAHIVIDLGGHTITGSPGVGDALFIKGASAVTIRNGYINQAGNGIEIDSSNNIVVHDVIIYNSAQYGILSEFCFGLRLQNITIESSGKDGVYVGVSNSVMVDTLVLNGNSNNGIQLDGVNGAQLERIQIYYASNNGIALSSARSGLISIIINDAVDTGSQNGSFRIAGFGGGNEIRAINFIDCFSTDSSVGGFIVSSDSAQVTDIVFQDCTVNRAGTGFYLEQINSDILENVMYKNCTVSGCGSGFLVQANDGNCGNVLFESCIATQNKLEGFLIQNGRNNLLTNCIATFNDSGVRIVASPFSQCLECESDTNSNHGFEIVSDYCLIESCKAAYNSGIGIFINGAKSTQVLNCRSSYNKIGIEDSGAASYIYGNGAFNNFGVDYDPPALAATTVAALNAPYWSNVRP